MIKVKKIKVIGSIFACILFGIIVSKTTKYTYVSSCNQAAIIFSIIYFISLSPIICDNKLEIKQTAIIAIIIAGLMFVRVSSLYYISADYTSSLSEWVNFFSGKDLFSAFRESIGDYNLPYLYILFLITRIKMLDKLVAIKAVSCFFDIVLSYYVMKCVGLKNSKGNKPVYAYIFSLALPTVILNGSFWGQCDSIYTAFCIGMVYYTLSGKDKAAVIMWTISFAVKIQAIFAVPFLILGLIIKKIQIKNLIWIPLTYIIIISPAFICGRSFADCINAYSVQVNEYPILSYNLPNIWTINSLRLEFVPTSTSGIFFAGAIVLLLISICADKKQYLDNDKMILAFFCFSLLLPFLLPRMHDRYYYLADVAALLLAFWNIKKWYIAVSVQLVSFFAYCKWELSGESSVSYSYLSILLLFVLISSFVDLLKDENDRMITN